MLKRTALFLFIVSWAIISSGSSVPSPAVVVNADNGDFVYSVHFSQRCQSGIGVGIAFDGEFLWYSCYRSNPDLFKANALTGQVVTSYNIAGGLGALAWDGTRNRIWAGWGGGSGASGAVRLFDPSTGAATIEFYATEAVIVGLDDGLAYDAQDDTLYISDDVSQVIYHYSTDGTLIKSFPWGGAGCFNSGVAIGGELLFQGSNGCNHIWVVNKSDHSPVFDFPTGAGGVRDEDLECDSVTFSPMTVMWSVEAYEPRRALAFEIPEGSCATGGGADSDGDGLLDEWEADGVTIDPDGQGPLVAQFIDLPAMGANVDRPDIFLHIDWMADNNHSHRLEDEAIRWIVEAFDSSPYTSPTGSIGINLHVDQGSNSILNFDTGDTWGDLSRAHEITHQDQLGTSSSRNDYNWSNFDDLKNASGGFTESGRTPIFHYVVSAHDYASTGSSGLSRGVPASDFIVSLGTFTNSVGTSHEQAGTLMHELGHNLGLCHGGPLTLTENNGQCNINFKPNYLSIMNYSFQLEGLTINQTEGHFDYSTLELPTLHEDNLDEPTGLGPNATSYGTRSFCNGFWQPTLDASGSIDWNCNNNDNETGVRHNINGENGDSEELISYEDWPHITFRGGAIGQAGYSVTLPLETPIDDYLTPELAEKILPLQLIADLVVTKSDSPDPVTTEQELTYELTVNNNGPGLATAVTLTDLLPEEVSLISATPSQGTCGVQDSSVTCELGDLSNGNSAIVTLVVTPLSGGTFINTVEVSSQTDDPNIENNVATEETTVILIVPIDIKPGGDPNSINCDNDKGVIAVAILTTDTFDATTVDHTTVTFEGASEIHADKKTGDARRHEEDVDDDGDIDLVFHFRFGDTALTCESTEGTLIGQTYDGVQIQSVDSVRTVPPAKVIVESDKSIVERNGNWTLHETTMASGGGYLYNDGLSTDKLYLAFKGESLEVVYVQHPALGTFVVEVDGVVVKTVKSRGKEKFGQTSKVDGLSTGPHLVRIYGQTDGDVISIDAFVVETPLAIPNISTTTVADPVPSVAGYLTRIESNDVAVQQDGAWINFNAPGASGASYLYSSGSTSDTLTLAFTGTQVNIIYTQHSSPISFVIEIDGQTVGSVSVSDPVGIFGWRTSVTELNFGQHTLRIVPIDSNIAIDAFEVETEHN